MRYLLLVFTLLPLISFAQFVDNFSDDDFSDSPTWIGNTDKFIVNVEQQLQLFENPMQGGTAYLSTSSSAINDATWEFFVKLNFNPSSTNYCEVYLTSNTADLSNTTKGYYLKIGGTNDDVCLYRKNTSNSTMIIDGRNAILNTNVVNLKVKVVRDNIGSWSLYTDTVENGNNYILEGTASDITYQNSSFFGVKCIYTQTRSQHFFFDNFVVTGEAQIDITPPILQSCKIISENQLLLKFNEPLEQTSSNNVANYFVNNNIGNPRTATYNEGDLASIILNFDNSFVSPNNYTIEYKNIKDIRGNAINIETFDFSYIVVVSGMIVVNEIMADPDPPVGLPNAEYVELYNTTNYTIDLTGWKYQIGSTAKILPSCQIAGESYLILCSDTQADNFADYGNVLGIPSFPTITNSGQTIKLYDNNLELIDNVSYKSSWYHDSNKANGGWSLEKIDPQNNCAAHTNWTASNSETGGTPGAINSVFNVNIDTIAPYLIGVNVNSGNEITVVFSEPVDSATSLKLTNYFVNNDFGNPIYAVSLATKAEEVILQFPFSFADNQIYNINIENIADWCGNIMPITSYDFSPTDAFQYDIIISEIMADPEPPALLPNAEYIEIYNRTSKKICLNSWTISVGSTKKTIPFAVIEANDYMLLCKTDFVNSFKKYTNNVLGVESFPTLANSGTNITLRNNRGIIINSVTYSDTWYNDNFKKNGGYSLEIIDINNPCGGKENWTATKDVSGGTPGKINSVFAQNPDTKLPIIIAAEIIAPDTVKVYFNEILQQNSVDNKTNFYIENFGNPSWLQIKEPDFSTAVMKFDNHFQKGVLYKLNVLDSIKDCSNNKIAKDAFFYIAIGDTIVNQDIVINEVLFNPFSNSKDFIEIYNRSNKIIDLKDLWISNKENNIIKDSYQITDISRLLLPNQYCAMTTDIQDIVNNYRVLYPENLYQIKNLVSMPDDKGHILLSDRILNNIDELQYDKSQHYKLLASQDGVSLERLDFDKPTYDLSNWHSASQTVGFATPGYQNSQFNKIAVAESSIAIEPKVFSPDNDGYEDRLHISYKLNEPGYTATIAIYNANGQFMCFILNNKLLEIEGTVFWDGFDTNQKPCQIGIYIVYVEMFNINGNKIVEKHAVTLSRKIY